MTKIIRIGKDDNTAEDFINMIRDKNIIVYEDVQGSKICVKYNGERFIIKPKSIKNDELNFVDLTVQNFYNDAYDFFNTLPEHIKDLLNVDWSFIFEYFPDNQPANIEYNKKPKNNLILTCIVKKGRYIYNIDEIVEYAKLFGVDHLPILFNGVLDEKQIEIIYLFLNTSEKDLKYVFDQNNFAKFFYDIINPNITNSFLMDEENFNENLEKIIIKLNDSDEFSFELLNPMYQKISIDNNTEHVEIYSLILISFLEFLQLVDFEKIKLDGVTKEELYVNMICKLFNNYIENTGVDYEKWNFQIPEFFKEDKFKINIDLLNNKKTIELVQSDIKYEYVFKVLLSSFVQKKKKPIGLFNERTVLLFNSMIDDISDYINTLLNINKEYKLQKKDLLNFNDFFDFTIDKDSQDSVYVNTFTDMDKNLTNMIDKKGKYSVKKDMKKESVNYTPSKYEMSEKISEQLSLGDILYEIDEDKFITKDYMVIKLTENEKEAFVCNKLINEKLINSINVFDVFKVIGDSIKENLYCIIFDDYEKLDENNRKMLKGCVNDVTNNKSVVEDGDNCYEFFDNIKNIQTELSDKHILVNDFSMNQYGVKNKKLVFVDYKYTDGEELPVEKELKI